MDHRRHVAKRNHLMLRQIYIKDFFIIFGVIFFMALNRSG